MDQADGSAPSPPTERWLYAVGMLVACGLCWSAWATVRDHQRAARSDMQVAGHMTGGYQGLQSRRGSQVVSTIYYPVFSYQIAEGRLEIGTASDSVARDEIEAGRTMTLRLVQERPTIVRLAAKMPAGVGPAPWILGGLACSLGLASLIGMIGSRRHAA